MKTIFKSLLIPLLLIVSVSFAQVRYPGRHHTYSHGGRYTGGHGSSHKGGHYHNSKTHNRYGRHR